MAENCSRNLIVEVLNAKNLMPKDGQGTASAYVIADFDGQRRRTKTMLRDLNPQWNEKLEFAVHDTESMAAKTLELNVYNDKKIGKRNNFLGKVKIAGSTFVKAGVETLVHYPLEKRSVFSQIKGEIGLRIWYVDEEAPTPPEEAAEKQEAPATPLPGVEEKPLEKEEREEEKQKEKEKKAPENPKPEEIGVAEPPSEVEKTPPVSDQSKQKMVVMKKKGDYAMNELEVLRSLSVDHRSRIAYDLVDQMPFLYVRVVKAVISSNQEVDISSSSVYAKLVIGTHINKTKTQVDFKRDWDQVFAFDKEGLNSSCLEVTVWVEKKGTDNSTNTDTSLGMVSFDLQEIPQRVPPDSPLAPRWYTLEGSTESSPGCDVMLAVWIGTQADEAFQEAWQSDSGGLIPETRTKVYLSPKLWYLRLTIIQTQDLQLGAVSERKVWNPELYVKAQHGAQVFKTSRTTVGSSSTFTNPTWKEELIFVAAEPFEPFLIITVEDVTSGRSVGHAKVHVSCIDKRTDEKSEPRSRWFNLVGDGNNKPYAGRIHVKMCLEGGYHVFDEAAHVTSDVRATAKQLSKPPLGLLELGIRGATNLLPVKTKDGTLGTTDAYVVAKYGSKWVRTRTILDRFNPRWNEQYTWNVYDPCTVLTIGVFDNGRYRQDETGKKDIQLGKLRIRLSTLDTNRVYMGSYSLMVLLPNGAKRMGEIEIAFRFSCSSWFSLIQAYASPMLPKMHYVRPLGPAQQDILRHTAMKTVTAWLARSEPMLGQEVVQFMLDSDTHMWSLRRSKANWFRVVGCLSRVATFAQWLDGIRTWVHPPTTILVHVLLVAIVFCPHLVLPTVFMYSFFMVALRFRDRQWLPISVEPRLSYADAVGPDELDEEFDGFPSTRSTDQVRLRYDRLRALAGRAQTLLGDVAAQGERIEALFNWRDPRATGIFAVVCMFASFIFYVLPFKGFVLGFGFYYVRHPRFRHYMPSVPINFFRRLPPLCDQIL